MYKSFSYSIIQVSLKMDPRPPAVEKSPYDKKQYRAVTLDNGIHALLISDNRTNSARPGHGRRVVKENHNSDIESDEENSEDDDSQADSDESEGVDSEECEDVDGVDSDQSRRPNQEKSQRVRSACGVCIRTGSYCDPTQVQGMAHLLEHMVFMGSQAYPGENTFDAFTTKHGGYDNASTDYEKSVFQFCIQPQHFQKGLDMFAHFFASPSLLKQSLEREIEAVDNEFQEAVQSDKDRIERLIATLAHPDHPFTNFVWGNRESLKKRPKKNGVDLHKALRNYYKRHYSSHYMTVAVMSSYPLDTLEQWTRDSFSAVPHNGLPVPTMSDKKDVFDMTAFSRLYKVVPVKDTHKLKLTWVLPPLMDKYRSKPLEYVSWLLGHEGTGSVLAELKKRNLATALVAGNGGTGYEWNTAFSLFYCDITLTDQGFEEVFLCITMVFQYLKMLIELGPQERVFQEIQEVNKIEFDFKEEEEPIDFVESLCEAMMHYPVEHYLTGDSLLYDFDPDAISSVLSQLTPTMANIILLSPRNSGQCTLKERWFKTPYCVEEIPSEWKTQWEDLELCPELHLPKPNPFIATDFSPKNPETTPTKYPVVIEDCPKFKLWYKKGPNEWPKAWICLVFRTHLYYQSPETATLMELFLNTLVYNTSEVTFDASVAQLQHSLDISSTGIALTVFGLNHKLRLFFQELVNHIGNFNTDKQTFKIVKEQLRKGLSNRLLKPTKLCKDSRLKVVEHLHWTVQDRLTALEHLSHTSLLNFVSRFKRQLFIDSLIQGNITPKEAREAMAHLIEHIEYVPMSSDFQAKIHPRAMQLPSNTNVCYRLENKNSNSTCTVITNYYQCCPRTIRDLVITELLSLCMDEPCFNELRTKQQLGYEVYTQEHNTHGVLALSLTLVTHATKFSDDYASDCMDKFIHNFHSELSNWTSEQFKDQVESLIQEKRAPDLSLEEEVLRNWSAVLLGDCCYDILERGARELESVTQWEVCDWLHRFTHPGPQYRKLSVKVVSGCQPSQVSRTNSSEEKVTRSQVTTSTTSTMCPQSTCSTESMNLVFGESSVDPPSCEEVVCPHKVMVCEGVKVCEGSVGVESFKASLFVYPIRTNLAS